MVRISAAESKVMDALWLQSPLTPEQIIAEIGPANDWTAGTVRTLITRLLHKKALFGAKVGAEYHYRPLIERDAYLQSECDTLLGRLFSGEFAPMVVHFANSGRLTPKDVQALKLLIAELDDAEGKS